MKRIKIKKARGSKNRTKKLKNIHLKTHSKDTKKVIPNQKEKTLEAIKKAQIDTLSLIKISAQKYQAIKDERKIDLDNTENEEILDIVKTKKRGRPSKKSLLNKNGDLTVYEPEIDGLIEKVNLDDESVDIDSPLDNETIDLWTDADIPLKSSWSNEDSILKI